MKVLTPSPASTSFLVKPRWPYDKVLISNKAYQRLLTAQNTLASHGLTLVLTRGYEARGAMIRIAHRAARMVGMALFCIVYPHRYGERTSIFSPNGHDRSGDCIDVSIHRRGATLSLLPFGVFTPLWMVRKAARTHQHELALAWSALRASGFAIHANPTEAMQIHCEAHR